jgi:MOSC domain-containing protein YiiM
MKFLRIGNLCLKVTGECKPCTRMDQVAYGLQAILTPSWRGGVTCQVVESGTIHLGDEVEIRDTSE